MKSASFKEQSSLMGRPELFASFQAHVGVGHKSWRNSDKALDQTMIFWGIGVTEAEADKNASETLGSSRSFNGHEKKNAEYVDLKDNQRYRMWGSGQGESKVHRDKAVVSIGLGTEQHPYKDYTLRRSYPAKKKKK